MFILLNDKSPLAIIRFFVENKGDFHVREVARRTTLSVGFVSRVLHELHKEGLFSAQKKGKMIFYSIELDNPIIKQIKTLFTVMKIYPLI
jgi:predicted nucleotidyltransferase